MDNDIESDLLKILEKEIQRKKSDQIDKLGSLHEMYARFCEELEKSAPEAQTEKYYIVRTENAGVFAGYITSRKGSEVAMRDARRIWFWAGASSLSQLAMEGTKKPDECKFPCEVKEVVLLGVVEILTCTEEARLNIAEVPVWKQ